MIKAYLVSMLVAFALSFLGCVFIIPLLRKLKAGQNILHYVKEHKSKSGTPTMGGIAFVFATLTVTIVHRLEYKINKKHRRFGIYIEISSDSMVRKTIDFLEK